MIGDPSPEVIVLARTGLSLLFVLGTLVVACGSDSSSGSGHATGGSGPDGGGGAGTGGKGGTSTGGTGGVCQQGQSCSDGDPCTDGDQCNAGVCKGQPIACTTPPAASCVDSKTLRSYAATGTCANGSCSYTQTDSTCPVECDQGKCVCLLSSWQWEAVTTQGYQPALALDAQGGVHMAWPASGGLMYAKRAAGGTWAPETVDQDSTLYSGNVSMLVDSGGEVHLAYEMSTSPPGSTETRYAHRATSGTWTTATIDTGAMGNGVAIAMDSAATLHVLYSMHSVLPSVPDMRYAKRPVGGSWALSTIDQGSYPALVLDAAGGLHAAYDDGGSDVVYAHLPPTGTWTETIAATNHIWRPSIALDAAGGVHIVHETWGDAIEYIYQAPGTSTWTTADLGKANYVDAPQVVVDATGVPHVVYTRVGDLSGNGVEYAYRSAKGTWQSQLLKASDELYSTRLAIDAAGGLHVAYEDESKGSFDTTLYYGEGCAGATCLSKSASCTVPGDCCSGGCTNGKCDCAPDTSICTQASDCCSGACNSEGTCGCIAEGGACTNASDCCGGACTGGICCSAKPLGSACVQPSECCSNNCQLSKCCGYSGTPCTSVSDCCPGEGQQSCGGSPARCCLVSGEVCVSGSQCCSGICADSLCG